MKLAEALDQSPFHEAERLAGYDGYRAFKWFANGWESGVEICNRCQEMHHPAISQHTENWTERGEDPNWAAICLKMAEDFDDWKPVL